jgi:hypothetical protein
MIRLFQDILMWIHDNSVVRWTGAAFLSLIYFLDDRPYHLIIVWATAMLADLCTRLWRLSRDNDGLVNAISVGAIRSANLIRGIGDELYQLVVWSFIAWAVVTPIPVGSTFALFGHTIIVKSVIRSLPYAYLAIGDIISIMENFLGVDKASKKQLFYAWMLETVVMIVNALRLRLVHTISGEVYTIVTHSEDSTTTKK